MRAKAVVGCAVTLAAIVATPQAMGAEGVPLTQRNGAVVSWEPRSNTAVVVLPGRQVLVIHALRPYAPGTTVRVRGVKWGSAIEGVKWGLQPAGVKWGIALARNGTFRSGLLPRGKATTMALRAKVIRRTKKNLVVSVPGATFVMPFAKRAVWLPGPKLVHGLDAFGTTVDITIRVTKGKTQITRVAAIENPAVGNVVPVAGKVLHRNVANRTMRVQAGGPAGVAVVVAVPSSVNMSRFPVGSEVSGTVVPGNSDGSNLLLTGISRNENFAAADSSVTTIGAPVPPGEDAIIPNAGTGGGVSSGQVAPGIPVNTPNPGAIDPITQTQIDALGAIRTSWINGRTGTPRLIHNQALYSTQLALLSQAVGDIASKRKPLAVLELVAFELVVGLQPASQIDQAFKVALIQQSTALRISLLSSL